MPELLREKTKAPSVEPGRYDLVVDPSNLFLTIHESIGHATELDRALGYEAAYAGTSFATVDKLGSLQYGSPLMNVTGDRTAEHGLSTVGYDDEGVAGQQWDIVRDGVLVGYQVDRNMARLRDLGRSNGCAFADSAAHVPVQRMANVSLQPAPDGPSTEEIIGGVDRGIYVVGDKSWSIDMQRYNFQFTGQRFYKIEGGRLAGQLKRRRLPGDDDRLLGLDEPGRRPADLRAGRCLQLRQGPARAGRTGQPRLPERVVREHDHPQHGAGGRAVTAMTGQQIVEAALAASTVDGQITYVVDSSEANLRWASNSLTTNGAMRSRQVVVISLVDGGAGMAAGTVARTGTPDIAELVAASEQAARDAGPAEDAVPLIGPGDPMAPTATGDWDAEPATTSIEVFRDVAPALGQAFGEAGGRDELLFGFAEHQLTTTYLGTSTGLRLRHDQPTGRVELNGKSRDFGRSVWAGVGTRDFTDVSIEALAADVQRKMAWSQRRVDLPGRPVRDAAAALGGQRPDDLRLLDDGGPRRRRGPQRLRQGRWRQPDR